MKTKYLIIALPLLWIAFSGCRKLLCTNVDCVNGTCNGIQCDCDEGWIQDEYGRCTIAFGCTDSACVHGTCNEVYCDCDPGWQQDADGHCTVPEPCYNVDCGHGYCNPSAQGCVCDIYYLIGTDGKCSKTWGENVAGTWRGTHQITFGALVGPYDMVITADALQPNKFSISNFGNDTCTTTNAPLVVTATMGSATSAIINQSLCTGVTGSGSLSLVNDTTISVSGTVTKNSTFVTFDGVFARQ